MVGTGVMICGDLLRQMDMYLIDLLYMIEAYRSRYDL